MTIQDAVSPLRRVFVRTPRTEEMQQWQTAGWRSAPDPERTISQHAEMCAHLEAAGAEVVYAQTPVPGDLDSIYTYDPTLMTDAGAIVLRPGKPTRRDEVSAMEADLVAAGVPIAGRLTEGAAAEGGDMFWLDSTTLFVGRGYRTNDAGIEQIRSIIAPTGANVLAADLPYHRGPGECVHLMTFISMLDHDLALCYLPMMPTRMIETMLDRGIKIVEVPENELDSLGPNVLALAPRVALSIEENPETNRRMEAAGVEVRTFSGSDVVIKGDGGPTCLTRPLDRA
jgi:N-dimethylarginine dimethylaminohydrolase